MSRARDRADGKITGDVVPASHETFSLGSAGARFNDGFFSASTVDIGGLKISKDTNGDAEFKDSSGAFKKIIANEIQLGTGSDKVVVKRNSSTGKVQFNTSDGSSETVDTSSSGVTIADTPPSNPVAGSMYFDSSELITYIYYSDGTSSQWVQTIPTASGGSSGIALTDISVATASASGSGALGYNNSSGVLTFTPAVVGGGTFASLTDTTVSSSNPTISSNPSSGTGHLWLNKTSGVAYICTDATTGANVWENVGAGTGRVAPITAYSTDFLVIAGGGSGGSKASAGVGGGGGAGGYRASYNNEASGGGGSSETALTFNANTVYTITIGTGGAGGTGTGVQGGSSSISGSDITDITTVGGGYGATRGVAGGAGGSGGGSGQNVGGGGVGTANQGYAGGAGGASAGGGGGGAGEVGFATASQNTGGAGGDGVASTITGSSVFRAGGGGKGGHPNGTFLGGAGGGGTGYGAVQNGTNGTVNTGSGGGGARDGATGGNGGSGVVILRMPTAAYSGTSTGSPTVTTDSTSTILTFTASGTYTG